MYVFIFFILFSQSPIQEKKYLFTCYLFLLPNENGVIVFRGREDRDAFRFEFIIC